MDVTFCPYCSEPENSLAFISKDQRNCIRACYDSFVHAYLYKKTASLDLEAVTDKNVAWHYSEEKLQLHFRWATDKCGAETDILGMNGYCPRCGHSNSRKLFFEKIDAILKELEEVKNTVTEQPTRDEVWNRMTKDIVSEFEFLREPPTHETIAAAHDQASQEAATRVELSEAVRCRREIKRMV